MSAVRCRLLAVGSNNQHRLHRFETTYPILHTIETLGMTIARLLIIIFTVAVVATTSRAFSFGSICSKRQTSRLFATKDEAAALTDFMAKAHEEKIRAMERVEAKYKDRVAELEAKVAELEGPSTAMSDPSSSNSFAFPVTNKLLTEKIQSYQTFISNYIVKASLEKQKAVKDAEAKVAAKYESLLKHD